MRRRSSSSSCFPLFLAALFALGLLAALVYLPVAVRQSFGPPSPSLNAWQRFGYALELAWRTEELTRPRDPLGGEQFFLINPGEDISSVTSRLESSGLVPSARALRIYLRWQGLDLYLQPGTYRLSPAMNARQIAQMIVSASSAEVTFVVLAGWRMEEIAASLPASGLEITPEAFLQAAHNPPPFPDLLPAGVSAEGFLAPGEYLLPRATTAEGLVSVLLQRSAAELIPKLEEKFLAQGLTLYQAVTLASIVQREAMMEEEMPRIASVFYNRLAIGMPLQADPTVQYALGYNAEQGTWWTNPLSVADLHFDSPYNTYLYHGLPPGPISNPGMAALVAVAFPEQTNYYFFQARCDHSGFHNFAETFEQHEQNYCP